MNWLKAMLLMVVLGAILYGVNVVLNKSAPADSPANNGVWSSADGPMGPPIVNPGTPGMNAPNGYGHSAYGQSPAGPSAYGPAGYATNPPAGSAATGGYSSVAPPPANPSPYGAGPSQTIVGSSPPATAAPANTPPPEAAPDQSRPGIPATPVGLVSGSQSSASSPDSTAPGGGPAFTSAMDNVMTTLRAGQLAEGLRQLTTFYDDPKLNADETKQMNDLLGRLAGTVIYSRQHLLCPPYEVRPGDSLETIATEYQVPARLLAKINGITDPEHLPAGQKLKVIHGPFMAFVSLSKREVTLVVQQCYAGRFKLTGVDTTAASLNGVYKVDKKTADLGAGSKLPLGSVRHWINFGDGFGFCGAADSKPVPRGLTLASADAEDLFDILSVGSSIVVR